MKSRMGVVFGDAAGFFAESLRGLEVSLWSAVPPPPPAAALFCSAVQLLKHTGQK